MFQVAIVLGIVVVAFIGLASSADDDGSDGSVQPTPTPTPGHYYRVQQGDILASVASRAYGTPQGTQANTPGQKKINEDPRNEAYRIGYGEKVGNVVGTPHVGPAFLPQWGCEDSPKSFRSLGGHCYGVLYIPE